MMKCGKELSAKVVIFHALTENGVQHPPPAVADGPMGVVIPSWRCDDGGDNHKIHRMMSRVGGFPPAWRGTSSQGTLRRASGP